MVFAKKGMVFKTEINRAEISAFDLTEHFSSTNKFAITLSSRTMKKTHRHKFHALEMDEWNAILPYFYLEVR